MSQPEEQYVGTALQEFFQWESQSWVEVVADMTTDEMAHFMPLENLKSYFAAEDCEPLSNILLDIFKPEYPPIDPDLILRDHTAVFCILLRIGQARQIEHFARYEELSDQRLPFDPSHPPRGFPEDGDDPNFLRKFCEKQWTYCVPVFDGHMLHKHFGRERLLPIIYKEPRGIEGMAVRYVIQLHGSYNKLLPAGQQMQPNNPNVNTFVLKTYSVKQGEGPYKQEVNGFRSVKHVDSIIRFFGSYIHGDEHNILLEYADKGSLEEFFKKETPPSRGLDIIKFWEGLFQLIKGLKAIHSVREGHYYVNPEEVLVLSNGAHSLSDWQFKLADFGLDHSKIRRPEGGEAMANEIPETSTYGAPECYMPYEQTDRGPKITWAADIWSLGCIYSEAAMWIADGYKGVIEYRKQRMAETGRILFKGGDCFHDGERALQTVLDAHRDIEDRLRRSDNITKDVLDSMVDEMLWEEDRPNAKALWRKAEMISSRARQRLSGDEYPRPSSSQSRSLPRLPPPTVPLPPIPRGLQPGLSSISERQPNVERWRSQVTTGSSVSGSQYGGPPLPMTIPTSHISSVGSVSELDRELNGSIASWQIADNSSTPFTSPHASIYYDQQKHNPNPNPNEGRARVLRNKSSIEYRSPPPALSHGLSYRSDSGLSHSTSMVPPPSPYTSSNTHDGPTPLLSENEKTGNRLSVVSDLKGRDETKTLARALSRASSRDSSAYSLSTPQSVHSDELSFPIRPEQLAVPAKSEKRSGGFSLFPNRTRTDLPAKSEAVKPAERLVERPITRQEEDSVPRSMPPLPGPMDDINIQAELSSSLEYLSLNTCLEWKKAHKKVKKSSKVPPLPGANMIEPLHGRDHIFIIDDSSSMSNVWPDVKRVFEGLSYVVKGMSPDGTELFFTISYDTWRRKDTHDLVQYLDSKTTGGETNISYRLDLQMQTYRARLFAARGAKGKKAIVRPMSFYILTNGEWGKGADPRGPIKEMADFLIASKMTTGQVTIEYISFAQTQSAVQRIHELCTTDFGLPIIDCCPWKGNVLKMLRGPLDRSLPVNRSGSASTSSRRQSSSASMRSFVAGGSSVLSELA